jgi:LPS sulfotransferase NodH
MSAPDGFIVLSTQRTGSHLLRSVIGSHPRFVHVGEALIPETHKPGSFDAFLTASTRASTPESLWREYLVDLCSENPSASYAGLLVKYEHVDRIMGRDLTRDPIFDDVRIIHLVRRNILRMVASHHLAVARGYHVLHEPIQHEITSVDLPVDGVLNHLRKKQTLVETFRGRLDGRPRTLEVAYEDIMQGEQVSDRLTSDLCRFFEVDNKFARMPETVKLGPDRLVDMVGNYDAVASVLAGSEFEEMLEKPAKRSRRCSARCS